MTKEDNIKDAVERIKYGSYKIEPANENDIDWIANKCSQIYKKDDDESAPEIALPKQIKLSWFKKNPKAFWIIKRPNGNKCGSFEILPLKRFTLDRMISGEIEEREITPDDIYSPQNTARADSLYLENVMVLNDDNTANDRAFTDLLMKIPDIFRFMKLHCNNIIIYAMPIKEYRTAYGKCLSKSERLLQELGFSKVAEATKQGFPFYYAELEEILKGMPFYTARFARAYKKLIFTPSSNNKGYSLNDLHKNLPPAPSKTLKSYVWAVTSGCNYNDHFKDIHVFIRNSFDSPEIVQGDKEPCPTYDNLNDVPSFETWARNCRRIATFAKTKFGEPIVSNLQEIGLIRNRPVRGRTSRSAIKWDQTQ